MTFVIYLIIAVVTALSLIGLAVVAAFLISVFSKKIHFVFIIARSQTTLAAMEMVRDRVLREGK